MAFTMDTGERVLPRLPETERVSAYGLSLICERCDEEFAEYTNHGDHCRDCKAMVAAMDRSYQQATVAAKTANGAARERTDYDPYDPLHEKPPRLRRRYDPCWFKLWVRDDGVLADIYVARRSLWRALLELYHVPRQLEIHPYKLELELRERAQEWRASNPKRLSAAEAQSVCHHYVAAVQAQRRLLTPADLPKLIHVPGQRISSIDYQESSYAITLQHEADAPHRLTARRHPYAVELAEAARRQERSLPRHHLISVTFTPPSKPAQDNAYGGWEAKRWKARLHFDRARKPAKRHDWYSKVLDGTVNNGDRVLELRGQGMTKAGIARRLNLSYRHVTRIVAEVRCRSADK